MPIKQIVAIRRKPGMTQAEFSMYVHDVHASIAAAQPLGVSRYVQNHAYDGAYGSMRDSGYAGISQTTIREDGKNFNDFPSEVAMQSVA